MCDEVDKVPKGDYAGVRRGRRRLEEQFFLRFILIILTLKFNTVGAMGVNAAKEEFWAALTDLGSRRILYCKLGLI